MKQDQKVRVPLVNGKYLFWTVMILVGELAIICGAQALNLLDNPIGYIVLPFFGFFTLYTAYEAAVLALEAISVNRDGIVVAGKDFQGNVIHFEKKDLVSIYPCDQKGNRIDEDQEKYGKIGLAFVLKNGNTRVRDTSRITQAKIDRLRQAFELSE